MSLRSAIIRGRVSTKTRAKLDIHLGTLALFSRQVLFNHALCIHIKNLMVITKTYSLQGEAQNTIEIDSKRCSKVRDTLIYLFRRIYPNFIGYKVHLKTWTFPVRGGVVDWIFNQ